MFGWYSYAWIFFLFVCSKGGPFICDVLTSLRTLTLSPRIQVETFPAADKLVVSNIINHDVIMIYAPLINVE